MSRGLRIARAAGLCAGLFATPLLQAHEGVEHREPAEHVGPPAAELSPSNASAGGRAPRLALSAAGIELVAALESDSWTIYLDDYATNTPLEGLDLRVQAGSLDLPAIDAGEGRYQVPAALFDPAEPRPVRFRVRGRAPGFADRVFDASLEGLLPAAAAVEPVPAKSDGSRLQILAISLVPLTALGLRLLRRRRV